MRSRFVACLLAACIVMISAPRPAVASIEADDWAAYKARFLTDAGRIVDDGNNGISHSEGQGYGLWLAYLAGDRAGFDQIWSFTRTELMLRDDGLAMWKWDPAADPHVTDPNNATDGDILIAYALAQAGEAWQRDDLSEAARAIAQALTSTLIERGGRRLILPGKAGYGVEDRPDGPVVNLSYWIFEAFDRLAALEPEAGWDRVSQDGVDLLDQSLFSDRQLPPDWLSVRSRPRPAEGLPSEFGYNALRIPLYLIRAGNRDEALLRTLRDGMSDADGNLVLASPPGGVVNETLSDPGYRILPALIDCVLDETPVPKALRSFEPTLYYPSTLHLLSLSFLAENRPECMP
ncbi:glycosyl hydrolase family 8 [Aureimonas mangrovi]|uniref:glycosyl hydrolase family 8 n=1 Tax=Aureimonas mangrovi TaxID=2758041 RepID=UPI00163D3F8A|nr:glycosyl hydrolase family 8 [Aureimonas mangrovi]